jgi:murein L,D-transpeptidase YafK
LPSLYSEKEAPCAFSGARGRISSRSLHCLLVSVFLLFGGPVAAGEVWLDIDTGHLTLSVMDDQAVVRVYEGIAIGRNGISKAKVVGDQKTPLGSYRVRRINPESRYHLFFGLDYPTMNQATEALQAHRISSDDWRAINLAHQQGREPPSNTGLGGNIGIHGIGAGDPQVHEDFNWTEGCIALTNEQIEELARWIHLGTRVVVR